MIDADTTTTRPRAGSVNQIIRQTREPQSPMRPSFGSANSNDEIMETFECYHFVRIFFVYWANFSTLESNF